MADYVISGCTTADLTQEYFDKNKVNLIPFHFSISVTEYEEDFGKTISYDVFYKRMRDGEITKTSQVTAGEYISSFEKYLAEGKDILHVTLSSGLSGTYQSAVNAMKILKEKYPERKIIIIDSLLASSGYGLFLDKLVTLKKEGKDLLIGFNPKFLVDALRVIDEEEVTIYMINSIAPFIIRDEQASYLYLILPINVNNSGI